MMIEKIESANKALGDGPKQAYIDGGFVIDYYALSTVSDLVFIYKTSDQESDCIIVDPRSVIALANVKDA